MFFPDGVDEIVAPDSPNITAQRVRRTSEEDQVEALDVLLALCRSPYFPFRIFVTTRPEKNITEFFDDAQPSTVALFLDSKYEPDPDIERFLWSKFSQTRRRFGISDASWPGQRIVKHLVGLSSGQFIVPATITRWIDSGIPQKQLDVVLSLQGPCTSSKNPFEPLDALYRHILTHTHNSDDDSRLVIKWILCIESAWAVGNSESAAPPAKFWRQMFEDIEGEFNY